MVSFDYFENTKLDLPIDESHNLLDRVRDMFSITLDTAHLEKVRKLLKPRRRKQMSKSNSCYPKSLMTWVGKVPGKVYLYLIYWVNFLGCAAEFDEEQQAYPV